ncbi:hypothetical protein YPPY66_1338 [Yersinia pestis PY-66]|uniref:Uncharacterized protein n=1 Tax=Yersinia pestis PY-08 TaxID=992134 RepID=A0AB72ZMX8_YERPE|nr:hypothetical protein YPC_0813 [Yersinia pestis biovar Medievalis str. Harbin 35]EEO75678.1 hypothetical protein YP516_3611 [Yersinia pestis Nepal516]EEO82898.1 hypothetical protein YPF_0874 [Yersinia pestis biovar Orientalis str. India 195]EEO87318.1 hypothetical protein YPH_3257 [Yersinia pestis biovar Orientalis str. PEXU2]EEO91614.1 hypothetical protein YPS_0558 [Yersinia pestis Pestoides A]EIQ92268.1 hypothetical protein YPPY01_1116 [Yersinia pestis PY-01]EIQ93000.1 hypothetical protei
MSFILLFPVGKAPIIHCRNFNIKVTWYSTHHGNGQQKLTTD